MNNGVDAIKIGITVIIVLLVSSLAFLLYNSGKDTADNALKDLNEMNEILEESKYTYYENLTITGNQVTSLVNKYNGDDVFVQVITKTQTSGTYYNYSDRTLTAKIDTATQSERLSNMTIKGSSNYVNPNGKFKCTIYRDANDTIMGIIFTQQ